MSSDQNKYGIDHLIGGTTLPKDANPAIRGSIRRADPDANPEPHFTGLNGTTLNLDYSPTGAQAINFTSDDLDDAITAINAVDVSNLKATEEDGYIRLQNLNGGSKNYLKVMGGTSAAILGFRVNPLPGSASFAGEISTASPGRQQGQNNPHGTALVAGDEDLTSAGINRAIIGALLHAERLAGDLDLESLAVQEVAVTVQDHPISSQRVFQIQDPTLRIPIRGFGIAVSNPAAGLLDAQFMLMEISGGQSQEYIDPTNATFYGRVINVYYDDLSNTLDDTASFVAWGTPDGKSIFNKTATDDKHAATAITAVDGDIISITGATFQALDCSPGDTVLIEAATNNDPFNHNGEFIITEVFGEEDIRVRPKTSFDRTFSSTDIPRGLNQSLPGGTSYGTLKVLIGDFISASDLVFEVAPTAIPASSVIRMLIGRRIQETRLPLADAGLPSLNKSNVRVAELIRIHAVTAASLRHASNHIDAPAVAGAPDSLTIGTVEAQLAELLGHVNNLIAGQVTYGGGVTWADGTPNPSVSLEAQVDKILTDLAIGAGSIKIASEALPAWADATANAAGAIYEQLDAIIQALALGAGSAKIAQPASDNWADGTANPAETLGARIQSIIFDLGQGAGAAKIHMVDGPQWHDETTNLAERLDQRVNGIITDLTAEEGADRIGSATIGSLLTGGSIKDQLVEVEAALVALNPLLESGKKNIGPANWASDGASNLATGGGMFENLVSTDVSETSIDLDVGNQITRVDVWASQAAAGTLTLSLHTISNAGVVSSAIATDDTATVDVIVNIILSGLTEILDSSKTYMLRVVSDGLGVIRIGNSFVTYDKLV